MIPCTDLFGTASAFHNKENEKHSAESAECVDDTWYNKCPHVLASKVSESQPLVTPNLGFLDVLSPDEPQLDILNLDFLHELSPDEFEDFVLTLGPGKKRVSKRVADSDSFTHLLTTKRLCRQEHKTSLAFESKVAESVFVQFVDCRTKNGSTKGRHEEVGANILVTLLKVQEKYYRQLQLVVNQNGRMQLQTPCRCGTTRMFTRRRAVRKGNPITYFATNKCVCGLKLKQTQKLLLCFCGALFTTTHSLFNCPCFGELGPAFASLPNYARFAPRPCPCPSKPKRRCLCLRSSV